MAAHPAIHPSASALRAFALGKLDDTTASIMMSHLDGCPECCKTVAALSGDDFLARLRQAHGRGGTPVPAGPLPVSHLPPELAANPQYEIQCELGRGGMGVVYLAKNKLMGRLEVLKVINKSLLDRPGAVERFLREIRSAAKLSHANVVAAYSAVQQGELLAFAMEYIDGKDLASLVKSQGPLPVVNACYYVQQAASGLQHAFEKGMVHRDIKPQNMILAREGKKHFIKVLDFGLAKVLREKSEDTGLTGEGAMLGTPDYIAPEQSLDAAKADIRADIYSLGCTLYYLLAGRPPFSAASVGAVLLAHQMQEAKPLNLVRPEVPEELAAVVRKMMAKSPSKRYQTPLEVVQALTPFIKQGAMPKPAPELSSGPTEASPAIKKSARVNSPPVAEVVKQPPPPANVWGALTEDDITSVAPRPSAVARKRRAATVRERTAPRKWLMGGVIGAGMILMLLSGMWIGGRFKGKAANGEPAEPRVQEPPAFPEPNEKDKALLEADANRLNIAVWMVVKTRNAGKGDYARALRQAEAAIHLAPWDANILNTLGVAQYRAGHYGEALATLTRSEKLNAADGGPHIADLAFLGMTQQHLGKKAEAKATLGRLREAMKPSSGPNSGENADFLREAEELIEGKAASKGP